MKVKWPTIGIKSIRWSTDVITFVLICHSMYVFLGPWRKLRSHFRSYWGQMTSKWSEMLTGELLDSLSFLCYVTQYWLWNTNFCDHGGNLRSHGCQMTFNWYLIHQDGPYLSFDMSHDICGEFLLVHWRSYGGQMTAKLSEMLTSELLKSLSFIWYVTWYWLWNIFVMEVVWGGHIFGQMTFKGYLVYICKWTTEAITFCLIYHLIYGRENGMNNEWKCLIIIIMQFVCSPYL